jgi:beta-1,4-N-acetylglucosaminyltransferase
MKPNLKKIALVCSVGGHLTQIQQLESLYKDHNYFFITEDVSLTRELLKKQKAFYVKLIDRNRWNFPLLFIHNILNSFVVFLKEKPDVVISTGALSAVPFCIWAKIFGKKVIYIESFAKRNSPNLSGKIIYRFADLFIVQWETMLRFYPKAIYGGSIY